MKLDEYVKQTLLDISNGVEQAQRESMHFIAPGYVNGERIVERQAVSFEVVVTVNKEVGGGISVFSIGDAKAHGESEHTNKISFEVPIYLNAPTEKNPLHHSRKNEVAADPEE